VRVRGSSTRGWNRSASAYAGFRQKQPGERIINRRLPSAELLVATGISLPFYATVLLCLNLYIITFSSFHVLPHSLSSFGLPVYSVGGLQ
jgi:hypothetical protein